MRLNRKPTSLPPDRLQWDDNDAIEGDRSNTGVAPVDQRNARPAERANLRYEVDLRNARYSLLRA
jgi:hypothetical protein